MKLYSAAQIRAWDQFTIENEPIASIDLMERAAQSCVQWLLQQYGVGKQYVVVCGKGNNGGDGLAISRLLKQHGCQSEVYILEFGNLGSPDFQTNLHRIHQYNIPLHFVQDREHFPKVPKDAVIIDAIFGSGLNRPTEGLTNELIDHINSCANEIVAIDVPSGLMLDAFAEGMNPVKATYTLSFQATKTAFLLPQNEGFTGKVAVLDIGLHKGFDSVAPYELIDLAMVKLRVKHRSHFSHKGTFGHALLVGGSFGKIGAMVLSAKALLRSGVGLSTLFAPRCGYAILQMAAPEAMTISDTNEEIITDITAKPDRFSAIGIGPGMGTDIATQKSLANLISALERPLVIDADGLNCLAQNKELLSSLPPQTILTPHPKEFERMFGTTNNDFEKIKLAQEIASRNNVIIVLKGHHSFIAAPNGPGYFNSTGNAGMATGGSGDVLTGLLTGLLAQGYAPLDAAIIGVYLHGLAGDLAAAALSQEAMTAGDLVRYFGAAFKKINQ